VNGLHSIYLQHEEPTAANNLTGQQQQSAPQQHHQQQLQAGAPQHPGWMQELPVGSGPIAPAGVPTAQLLPEQQQQQQYS
jgi:hypothetical protein